MEDAGLITIPSEDWNYIITNVEKPGQEFYNKVYLDVSQVQFPEIENNYISIAPRWDRIQQDGFIEGILLGQIGTNSDLILTNQNNLEYTNNVKLNMNSIIENIPSQNVTITENGVYENYSPLVKNISVNVNNKIEIVGVTNSDTNSSDVVMFTEFTKLSINQRVLDLNRNVDTIVIIVIEYNDYYSVICNYVNNSPAQVTVTKLGLNTYYMYKYPGYIYVPKFFDSNNIINFEINDELYRADYNVKVNLYKTIYNIKFV